MKDIKGYEGIYAVTSCGKVWSYKRKRFLKAEENIENGYLHVILCNKGKSKTFSIHRLVAMAYIEKCKEYNIVNHKDGNRHNNCVNNLEWCTQAYNINYSIENIRKSAQKRCKKCICVETMEVFESPLEIANKFNVRYYKVTLCCRNKTEEINGLHFEYI